MTVTEMLKAYFISAYRDGIALGTRKKEHNVRFVYPARVGGYNNTRETWGYPLGRSDCMFLENDRCRIHPVKPYECRESFGCSKSNTPLSREPRHRNKALLVWVTAWKKKKIHPEIVKFIKETHATREEVFNPWTK